MDGIKIEVTGNIARVIEKPARITSGTVGLPIEFTFDNQWLNLTKVAMFRAGHITKTVSDPEGATTVPWEVLTRPNVWLSVGAYGVNRDGTVVIPTIWANVCPIQVGVTPEDDPSTDPTLPIWQEIKNYVDSIIIEGGGASSRISYITLPASEWTGKDGLYSQVVAVEGATAYSKVDLLPSVEQLAVFHNKDITFVTENEGGVVKAYAIGEKPLLDYTMQVQITEVVV